MAIKTVDFPTIEIMKDESKGQNFIQIGGKDVYTTGGLKVDIDYKAGISEITMTLITDKLIMKVQ